jgi:hypothetical protein
MKAHVDRVQASNIAENEHDWQELGGLPKSLFAIGHACEVPALPTVGE